jgi:methionyl-tRNA synthetase
MSSKFYITTAIDYVNAQPHLGHAYEKIVADVYARWHRMLGEKVFFLIGSDENAKKVAEAAKQAGLDPQTFTDQIVQKFKELYSLLNISYDYFVRTTEDRHKKAVQTVFSKLYKKGDIYKGQYRGLYCVACEAFYLERELKAGLCPIHHTRPEIVEEPSYFFKLSKYQNQIVNHIKKNSQFILPESRRTEILNRLNQPLKDVSISRYRQEWGIKIPFDPEYTIYVWFDALLNYISALDWPEGKFKKFWPANIHLIGNEILWFHTVIWPAMLLALDLPLPKTVFSHGMITLGGQKLSKTRGIVVDPFELVKKYGSDQLRYFLIREAPLGQDLDFSEKAMKERINGELVADLGNLVNRVLVLAEKFSGKIEGEPELEKELDFIKIKKYMDNFEPHHALDTIWQFIRAANKYINERQPWKLSGDKLGHVLYNLLESIRVIAILIEPFLPLTAQKIAQQLGMKLGNFSNLKFEKWSGKIQRGPVLFEKV